MKKVFVKRAALIFAVILCISLAAPAVLPSGNKGELSFAAQTYAASKSLIISFDVRKNIGSTKNVSADVLSSATVYSGATGEEKSTEEVIRDTINTNKKSTVFEIQTKKAYSKNYSKILKRAAKEINSDSNVKLKKNKISKLSEYNTVYLVTPVWHGTLPQPVKELLRSNDFKGKTIYVFCVNLGSGFGDTISSVKEVCPGATVLKGKAYYGDAKNNTVKKKVQSWLKKH